MDEHKLQSCRNLLQNFNSLWKSSKKKAVTETLFRRVYRNYSNNVCLYLRSLKQTENFPFQIQISCDLGSLARGCLLAKEAKLQTFKGS